MKNNIANNYDGLVHVSQFVKGVLHNCYPMRIPIIICIKDLKFERMKIYSKCIWWSGL